MSSQIVTKKRVPLGEITSNSGVHHCDGGPGVKREALAHAPDLTVRP